MTQVDADLARSITIQLDRIAAKREPRIVQSAPDSDEGTSDGQLGDTRFRVVDSAPRVYMKAIGANEKQQWRELMSRTIGSTDAYAIYENSTSDMTVLDGSLFNLEQDGAGDASMQFELTGGQTYSLGYDQSAGVFQLYDVTAGAKLFHYDSDGLDIASGDAYHIGNASVLTATTLGGAVVNSSLTGVGTIATGVWEGTDVGLAYGGTGASLSDPGADRIFFWDDGAGSTAFLVAGDGIEISTTNLQVDFNTTNLKITSNELDTIQSIAIGASPTFVVMTLSQATGTAPLTISSTTKVANLNVDLLDDQTGSYYLDSANWTGTNATDLTDAGATTLHKHDHGGQDGLGDDDHTIYILASGSRAFSGDIDLDGHDLDDGGVIFLREQAAADADVANQGQIWVKTGAPNTLWFTDDGGTDREIVYSGGAFHDGFSDFVGNEHINHTSVTLTAGTGLSGGGTITGSRTFNVNGVLEDFDTLGAAASDGQVIVATGSGVFAYESGATLRTSIGVAIGSDIQAFDFLLDDIADLTDPGADRILFWDESSNIAQWLVVGTGLAITTTTIATDDGAIVHDSLSGAVANEHIDHTSVTFSVGAGLTGGGDLSSNRSFAVDGVLEDIDTLGIVGADSEFMVGTGSGAMAWESGATLRTSIGVGTGDSPTFTGLTLSADLVMGDASITGIDALTFTDTGGLVAGIANGNLLDKSATESVAGTWTFTGTSLDVEGYMAVGNGLSVSAASTLIVDRDFSTGGASRQLLLTGRATITGGTSNCYGALIDSDITINSGGTHGIVAQMRIGEPNPTLTSGTITNAVTLYIPDAPTEGTNNYALWVDAGAVQFDETLDVTGIAKVASLQITGSRIGPTSDLNLLELFSQQLLVRGDAEIHTASPGLYLMETDTSDTNWAMLVSGGELFFQTSLDNKTRSTRILFRRDGALLMDNVGSDPATPANTAGFFCKDVASSGEAFAIDEADNITQLSPHDRFGNWTLNAYASGKDQTLIAHMEAILDWLVTEHGMPSKFVQKFKGNQTGIGPNIGYAV